jgi:hypothetical protein
MTSLEGAGDVGQAAWAVIPIGPGITRGSRRRARNRTGDRTPARQRGFFVLVRGRDDARGAEMVKLIEENGNGPAS